MLKSPLLVIVGPTAIGKSAVALEVADRIDGEIISADSMQVYRGMDIGTAKLTPSARMSSGGKSIRHHLLDIISPEETFNAADYQKRALKTISEVIQRHHFPLLVGGTGLYINAVINRYAFKPPEASPQVRENLLQQYKVLGKEAMYNKLQTIDFNAAKKIHPNDQKRIIRALEVFIMTGKPFSELKSLDFSSDYNLCIIGLTREREKLYQLIDARVEKMFEAGLVQEVKKLLKSGLPENNTAFQAVGYKETVDYLLGKYSLEETKRLIKRNTRQYAKRQLTWFKKDQRIFWIDIENLCLDEIVEKICQLMQDNC